jgi:hypothetical protein
MVHSHLKKNNVQTGSHSRRKSEIGTVSGHLLVEVGRSACDYIDYKVYSVEAAEGRTAHNNGWNGVIGMAFDTIPLTPF